MQIPGSKVKAYSKQLVENKLEKEELRNEEIQRLLNEKSKE